MFVFARVFTPLPSQDSGAQYLDGTTDVTRTVHFGDPTPHERHCFTLVLKVLACGTVSGIRMMASDPIYVSF